MKRILFAVLLLSSFAVTGCSAHNEATPPQEQPVAKPADSNETAAPAQETPVEPSTPNMATLVQEPEFSKIYNSLDELAEVSDLVVEGKVVETTPYEFKQAGAHPTSTMTKVQVEVKKSLNDTVNKGDVITVIEMGGITTKRAIGMGDTFKDMTPEQLDEKVQVLFTDVPLMVPNDEVFLFLNATKMDQGPNGETYYTIPGIIQGKFKIKNNHATRVVPKNMGPVYKSLDNDLADTEPKVQGILKQKKNK